MTMISKQFSSKLMLNLTYVHIQFRSVLNNISHSALLTLSLCANSAYTMAAVNIVSSYSTITYIVL